MRYPGAGPASVCRSPDKSHQGMCYVAREGSKLQCLYFSGLASFPSIPRLTSLFYLSSNMSNKTPRDSTPLPTRLPFVRLRVEHLGIFATRRNRSRERERYLRRPAPPCPSSVPVSRVLVSSHGSPLALPSPARRGCETRWRKTFGMQSHEQKLLE